VVLVHSTVTPFDLFVIKVIRTSALHVKPVIEVIPAVRKPAKVEWKWFTV